MAKENEIVEALRIQESPYSLDTHKRLARQFDIQAHVVARVARDNSLILDRAITERKLIEAARAETAIKPSGVDERNELTEQLARMRISNEPTRLEISDFQYRREVDDLNGCLKTLEQVTPELLARVGLG